LKLRARFACRSTAGSPNVYSLLLDGERRILLDLGRLSDLDAGGVGELVHAFNTTNAKAAFCG
jgi:hypothetical protein